MPEHYLRGQVITPRHPRKLAFLLITVPVGLLVGSFGLGTRFPARPAPSWPPAHVKLVPPIPEPQGHVTAYVETDQNWIVAVTWEPLRPGRFLGVEKVEDACRIHVAAEAPCPAQLQAIQAGTATCFETAFTRERDDDE